MSHINFVQTETIPDLLCAICKKVLSYFPVYCYKEGSACGRCNYPENGIRNEAYEAIAQNLKFPCCFNEYGCLENLYPKDVAKHEKMCTFRKYKCPVISNKVCEWKGSSKDILGHFENIHPSLILSENYFEIDFIHTHNENYLFPYGEGLYLVNRRTDLKKPMFICTVSYIGNDSFEKNTAYRIILENGNKSSSHIVSEKVNNTIHIYRDFLNEVLNEPLVILAKIEIFQVQDNIQSCDNEEDDNDIHSDINYELLRELECLVCLEYMVPPIQQCVTGHSVCLSCRQNLTECPVCKKEFQNTQNFALAQIIQHILYPCKNAKCKFTAKAKDIKQHEATCTYSPFPCPLKDYVECNAKLLFDDIYDHIQTFHYENLLEMDVVSMPFMDDEILSDCFIIKHNSLLFALHLSFMEDENNEFLFAVQLIGPADESTKYRFEIDILDNSGNNYRALMSKSCGPLSKDIFSDTNYMIIFTYEQIKKFISDQFCFRARILNN